MNREVKRLDESHDQMSFQMQSTSERDAWMRTFPWPIPSTHQLVYRWEGVGGMHLTVEMVAKPIATAAPKQQAAETELKGTTGVVAPATAVQEPSPAPVDLHADARQQCIVELQIRDLPDLRTLATEIGVVVAKNASKAQIIAAIADKRVPVKTE